MVFCNLFMERPSYNTCLMFCIISDNIILHCGDFKTVTMWPVTHKGCVVCHHCATVRVRIHHVVDSVLHTC